MDRANFEPPEAEEINPWNNKPFSEYYYLLKKKREELPVYQYKSDIIRAVKENQVVIIEGATGSGKTTQIPQFILESGIVDPNLKIICSQPRRIAAIGVATRVAKELDVETGGVVGYSVRFNVKVTEETKLIYMTDGILLHEFVTDPWVSNYGLIIIDEAHERNVNTDIILGLLKILIPKRKDLKVIIMSATLESNKFTDYFKFGDAEVPRLDIPGRLFNVNVIYSDNPISNYLNEAVKTVCDIHLEKPPGGILLFLTGQEEIVTACSRISDIISREEAKRGIENKPPLVCPLYAELPPRQQELAFQPVEDGVRKIIVCTNIAETSVTIDGIVYVVDSGFVKQSQYDPDRHMNRLVVVPISKASANQRKGRAGRTREGVCYRLYTEPIFDLTLQEQAVPEIQRTDLASVILTLLATGVRDIVNFPFLDQPPKGQMMSAVEDLYFLNAITLKGELTDVGKQMSQLPLEPDLAKTLLSSYKFKCSRNIAMLVALISEQGRLFSKVSSNDEKALRIQRQFQSETGDHLTYLNVFENYTSQHPNLRDQFCKENYLEFKFLQRVDKTYQQLLDILGKFKIPITTIDYTERNRDSIILRAMLEGMFQKVAMFSPEVSKYIFLFSPRDAEIHPSSCICKRHEKWVLYNSYIFTKADYLIMVSKIDPSWFFEAAPNYFQKRNFKDSLIRKELFSFSNSRF